MNTFQAGDQVTHLSRSDGRGQVVGSGDEGYVWVNWPNRIGSQHERIDYLKHAEHEPHVGLRKVHDHSPEERHGLDCAEFAHPDGRPVGACIVNAEYLKHAEPAPTIHEATMSALHKKWDADRKYRDDDPSDPTPESDPNYAATIEAEDVVSAPSHYRAHPSGIEVIDITRHESFLRGNVLKYVLRAPYKNNELEDLKKASQYLAWEIERLEQS